MTRPWPWGTRPPRVPAGGSPRPPPPPRPPRLPPPRRPPPIRRQPAPSGRIPRRRRHHLEFDRVERGVGSMISLNEETAGDKPAAAMTAAENRVSAVEPAAIGAAA